MKKETSSGGIFTTLLLILFIALKLCHIIDWSWVWVLSPFWIPFAIAIALLIGYVIFYLYLKSKEGK